MDAIDPFPEMEALTLNLIFSILVVKNDANLLTHDSVERSSGAIGMRGFDSRSTVENNARVLLLFLIISEKSERLAFRSSRLQL